MVAPETRMTKSILRPARADDVPALANLAGQLGYTVTVPDMAGRLSRLPESEAVIVAEASQSVVGWMQIGTAFSIESEPFVEIRGLVVDSSHRAAGVGVALIDFAKTWTRSRGFTSLRVRSNVLRTATHGFYLRRGFELIKEQKVFSCNLAGTVNRVLNRT